MTFNKLFKSHHSSWRSSTYAANGTLKSRAGVITFWAIVSIPLFLCLMCVVIEVGNLWLARIQLKNALESAALAGVKHWGDNGGGDTQASRIVGNAFASSLVINGVPVDLSLIDNTLNYDVNNSGNQNATCDGLLVFGALVDDSPEYVFDACETAGCGVNVDVLIDASSNGNLDSENDWGVSVQPTAQTTPGTYVTRVVIRLPGADANVLLPFFDFTGAIPVVSSNLLDNVAANKVRCDSSDLDCGAGANQGRSQADVFGIDSSDISFGTMSVANFGDDGFGGRLECSAVATPVAIGQTSKVLVMDFCTPGSCNNGTLGAFVPGDRFRFGANVNSGAIPNFDGDNIGSGVPTEVTICFSTGDVITGQFVDTNDRILGQEGNCSNVTFASWGECDPNFLGVPTGNPGRQGMIINGADAMPAQRLRADQPQPPSQGNNNNGQSLVLFNATGGAGLGFAVRAQASYDVPSICKNVFGVPIGPFCVTAKADALYECTMDSLRIYHLDDVNFLCSDPINCP